MAMFALVHDSLSPIARSDGAILCASWMRKFLRLGGDVRAGWQEWQKMLARLQRNAAKTLVSRWRSGRPARAVWDRIGSFRNARTDDADHTSMVRPADSGRR